jgi:transglutaminase-like putative cysteine protease
MRYHVTHSTTYSGDQPVSICHNEAWLEPRDTTRQLCEAYRLDISPAPSWLSTRVDYFGNHVSVFSFQQGYDTLTVTADSEIQVRSRGVTLEESSPPWESVRDALRTHADGDVLAACEFAYDSPRIVRSPELAAYAAESFTPGRPIIEALADLTARVHGEFEYDPRSTTVTTPVSEVLRLRKGVCQDFAHVQIAALRSLGLAARYVSGYLRTYPPEGQPRLVGVDASHAWLAVYCGPLGWVDVDPTNNLFPDLEHLTVAWGRDYSDVCPLKGVYLGGGHHTLSVSVNVECLESGPGGFAS